jgi:hypothetical protein
MLCVYVSPPQLLNARTTLCETWHLRQAAPISAAYFINPSHQSVWLYVFPPIVARQRL